MKPLYVFLLLYAVFITFLADGLQAGIAGLGAAPASVPIIGTLVAGATAPMGIALGLVVSWCINITLGSGLLLALVWFGMWHPRFSPFGIIGGLIPGLNVLPFWVGLVIAGIVYKMNAEGENLGGIANVALKLQSAYQSGASPLSTFSAAKGIIMNERRATGRPPQAAQGDEPQNEPKEKSRSPLNLKSPRMNDDIQYAKAS